jgi:hypothetical protein
MNKMHDIAGNIQSAAEGVADFQEAAEAVFTGDVETGEGAVELVENLKAMKESAEAMAESVQAVVDDIEPTRKRRLRVDASKSLGVTLEDDLTVTVVNEGGQAEQLE